MIPLVTVRGFIAGKLSYKIYLTHNIPSNAVSAEYEFWTNDDSLEHKSGSWDMVSKYIELDISAADMVNVTTKHIKFIITYDDGTISEVVITK